MRRARMAMTAAGAGRYPSKRRLAFLGVALVGLLSLGAGAAPVGAKNRSASQAAARHGSHFFGYEPLCQSDTSLCADVYRHTVGQYVGHDEPSVEFKSSQPGSGNDMTYTMTLPKDPSQFPNESGAGGSTWNFELRPTFWFGLSLCDSQSAPEYTHRCKADSDSNNLVGTDPSQPDYLGKHPGTAYMELQFYEPGYVEQFTGFGCTAKQYCAAMNIDSFLQNQNNGVYNTTACDQYLLGGVEPINWAYVTRSGKSQAPANPLFTGTFTAPNFEAVNPNPSKDLMMNPGDTIRIHMHDTPAGFRTDLTDLTTGQSGSMTASTANGFGHILYTPDAKTCREEPYAFHPQYSTANPRGAVWTAHTYNVAMSDEIGHFENCRKVSDQFNCEKPGSQDAGGLDEDDDHNFCIPGSFSTLVHIDGCFSSDADWDSQAYRPDWPGTNPNPAQDSALHPTPVLFTSPVTARNNYPAMAFETDLPATEGEGAQDNPPFCNSSTGAHCVNPPNGATFYPFFTTGMHNGTCMWQEGGNFIPGTTNHFGGSSTTEFGPLLKVVYPVSGFTTVGSYEDFNSRDIANPCPATP